MILKWAIGGAVVGAIGGIILGSGIIETALVDAVAGVIIRKWIFRKLWM